MPSCKAVVETLLVIAAEWLHSRLTGFQTVSVVPQTNKQQSMHDEEAVDPCPYHHLRIEISVANRLRCVTIASVLPSIAPTRRAGCRMSIIRCRCQGLLAWLVG